MRPSMQNVALGVLVLVSLIAHDVDAFIVVNGCKSLQQSLVLKAESLTTVIEYNDFLPSPNPEYNAEQVVRACMDTLLRKRDEGLEVCFNFSSDQCRASLGGSLEKFVAYANNPVFGFLVKCADWKVVSIGPVIKGTPTRGSMQTVLMDAIPPGSSQQKQQHVNSNNNNPEPRRFLWTLQQERRPPRQGCWVIHEVIYVRNAYALTL